LKHQFAAYNDFYACFCDALADVVVEDQVMDAGTIEGISRCAHWMKHRMQEFRTRLKVLQEKACTREPD